MNAQIDASLETLAGHGATPQGIKDALRSKNGSQFFRCAFQVNPFAYAGRHSKENGHIDEASYNEAMLNACTENGVHVVAITDHFRFDDSDNLRLHLENSGIIVFPGFEANSSDGIHILCLFAPGTTVSEMNNHIGACDIRNPDDLSPISKKSFEEILQIVDDRGGITIAAHATQKNGLLKEISGQTRINSWTSPLHLACAIPGSVDDVPPEFRQICLNKDSSHKRDRPVSFVNAADVTAPSDLERPGSTTLLKMTDVSIEGLRQAFLDGESRIIMNSEELPSDFTRIVAVCWDGGLLDGQFVALNSGLNVMIGGRGAGKSTIVESLRYAFELPAIGVDAGASHESMIKHLLGPRSNISVLLFSPKPSPGYYLIERAYRQDPRVRNQKGEVVPDLRPEALVPGLEVYGQHEISEITRQKSQLAELLERFVGDADEDEVTVGAIMERFRTSRRAVLEKEEKIEELELALAALPGLKEKLRRFEETELAVRLDEQAALQEEQRLLDNFATKIVELDEEGAELKPSHEQATKVLPNEEDMVIPHREDLAALETIAANVHNARRNAADTLTTAAQKATTDLAAIRAIWKPKAEEVEGRYNALKKELEGDGFEPDEYLTVKGQVAELEPKQREKEGVLAKITELKADRAAIVDEWQQADRNAYRALERAAARVSRKLQGTVRASVRPNSELGPLEKVLRDGTEGQIGQALAKLQELDDLSTSKLAATIRKGSDALVDEYGFTEAASQKIAAGGEALALQVEEVRIPPEAVIELNVGRDEGENWKELSRLSAGQKATAVLMLLLLDSEAPLIIDQPEDDLDNEFIARRVVPSMRVAKKKRQFLFSSHNPNIPVLGDADQIIGLTPVVEDGTDRTKIEQGLCGSIDRREVQDLIKDLLEGGRDAFTERRTKYGF